MIISSPYFQIFNTEISYLCITFFVANDPANKLLFQLELKARRDLVKQRLVQEEQPRHGLFTFLDLHFSMFHSINREHSFSSDWCLSKQSEKRWRAELLDENANEQRSRDRSHFENRSKGGSTFLETFYPTFHPPPQSVLAKNLADVSTQVSYSSFAQLFGSLPAPQDAEVASKLFCGYQYANLETYDCMTSWQNPSILVGTVNHF